MFYQEGSSLDLDLIVQNYESDRERYWGEDEQTRRYLQLVDQLAQILLRGTTELVQPQHDVAHPAGFTWEQVRFLADQASVAERVLEKLEIEAAWAFAVETRAMARRCLELAQEVVAAEPNESVLRFLRRLSRCYIAGFLPECVMLCRAVVENALADKFDRERVAAESRFPMRTRIDTARRFKWITDHGAENLWTIWKRGSKAVHEDPEATKDVLQTIRMAMAVLKELYER